MIDGLIGWPLVFEMFFDQCRLFAGDLFLELVDLMVHDLQLTLHLRYLILHDSDTINQTINESIDLVPLYLRTPYLLTLPAGRMPIISRHPALRPQHGPSAHPRQTSRSIEPLWSFGKPQEEKPMDVTQRIQWKCKISKDIRINAQVSLGTPVLHTP